MKVANLRRQSLPLAPAKDEPAGVHPADGAAQPGESRSDRPGPAHPRRLPVPRFTTIAALALLGGVAWNAQHARQAPFPEGLIQANGRIEGDRITIASKYAGRMTELLVHEGDAVRMGQVLARLDDAEIRARLRQAEANLQALLAQGGGAVETVALTAETTSARVQQGEGVLRQAESGVSSAREEVARVRAAVEAAGAREKTVEAQARAARAALETAQANQEAAQEAVRVAEATWRAAAAGHRRALAGADVAQDEVEAAEANLRVARASVDSAQAAFERAYRDARRHLALFDEGATSAATRDAYVAAEKQALAALDGARAQMNAAEKAVQARRSAFRAAQQQATEADAGAAARLAEVEARRRQVTAAEGGVRQARAQSEAAEQETETAYAGVLQAQSQFRAAGEAVRQAEARRLQAAAQLAEARTAPRQVVVSQTHRTEAQARIRQARAAVDELRSTLSNLTVTAPAAGTVTARVQEAGEVVGAGAPLLEVVDLDRLYLKVYVPENQIGRLRLGLPAQIYTDAFPRRAFPAEVRTIASRAEFTPKEVQTQAERVKQVYAVKLYLQANPEHRLTPGLPADAVIRWKEGTPWVEPRW